jgi:hypothetical protein
LINIRLKNDLLLKSDWSFIKSIPLEGKNEALGLETVGLLVNLLKDQDKFVRAKAALAIEA